MRAAFDPPTQERLEFERWEALRQFVSLLEGPMTVLGFVWLGIVIADLTGNAGPLLTLIANVIWLIFALDFLAGLIVAPRKSTYLRTHWLAALALALPALRVLRFVRLLRVARAARLAGAARGATLLRLVSSFNRGMQALRRSMARRGFGYVVALTTIVVLAGAAGMLALEGSATRGGQGLANYGEALWWTAMIMTTMGTEFWPHTAAGRVLCLLLALYAFAMFGYVTATLATFFVGRDAENEEGEVASEQTLRAISSELETVRRELEALKLRLGPDRDPIK